MYLYFRASIWETGGYYIENHSELPLRGWTHLALVYHVIPSQGNRRLSVFATHVNGLVVLNDNTQFRQDTAFGDGRIVLGRAYSEVDDFYTSMTIAEVEFYNDVILPADIFQLYETGRI